MTKEQLETLMEYIKTRSKQAALPASSAVQLVEAAQDALLLSAFGFGVKHEPSPREEPFVVWQAYGVNGNWVTVESELSAKLYARPIRKLTLDPSTMTYKIEPIKIDGKVV